MQTKKEASTQARTRAWRFEVEVQVRDGSWPHSKSKAPPPRAPLSSSSACSHVRMCVNTTVTEAN